MTTVSQSQMWRLPQSRVSSPDMGKTVSLPRTEEQRGSKDDVQEDMYLQRGHSDEGGRLCAELEWLYH